MFLLFAILRFILNVFYCLQLHSSEFLIKFHQLQGIKPEVDVADIYVMAVFVRYDFYLFHTVYVCNKIPRAAVVIAAHISNATITQPPIFPSLSSVFHCRIVSEIADNAITQIVADTTSIKKPICCLTISFLYLKSSCCG